MIITRDANKITRLKINHNASKQEFQEQKALEDFRKIEWYFEHFCEILESTGGERILVKCENYRGIQVTRNCKAVGTKYTQNNRDNFGVSCNNEINWEQK